MLSGYKKRRYLNHTFYIYVESTKIFWADSLINKLFDSIDTLPLFGLSHVKCVSCAAAMNYVITNKPALKELDSKRESAYMLQRDVCKIMPIVSLSAEDIQNVTDSVRWCCRRHSYANFVGNIDESM